LEYAKIMYKYIGLCSVCCLSYWMLLLHVLALGIVLLLSGCIMGNKFGFFKPWCCYGFGQVFSIWLIFPTSWFEAILVQYILCHSCQLFCVFSVQPTKEKREKLTLDMDPVQCSEEEFDQCIQNANMEVNPPINQQCN